MVFAIVVLLGLLILSGCWVEEGCAWVLLVRTLRPLLGNVVGILIGACKALGMGCVRSNISNRRIPVVVHLRISCCRFAPSGWRVPRHVGTVGPPAGCRFPRRLVGQLPKRTTDYGVTRVSRTGKDEVLTKDSWPDYRSPFLPFMLWPFAGEMRMLIHTSILPHPKKFHKKTLQWCEFAPLFSRR